MMARIRALKETALAAHKAGEIPILSENHIRPRSIDLFNIYTRGTCRVLAASRC
jgi:hypothetical protein